MLEITRDANITFPAVKNAWLEFVNSEWGDMRGRWRDDRLLRPVWLAAFLQRWQLEVEGDTPCTPAILEELLDLRTLMRQIVQASGDETLLTVLLERLNTTFLRRANSYPQLTYNGPGFQLQYHPYKRDWAWVQSELARSLAEQLASSELQRLKICENQACLWIFYDETRSRTRRYCLNNKCGNLLKLRRFRARHRQEKS